MSVTKRAAGSHDPEGSEDQPSSTSASHRVDCSDFTGDVTQCSSSADSAEDRGGS